MWMLTSEKQDYFSSKLHNEMNELLIKTVYEGVEWKKILPAEILFWDIVSFGKKYSFSLRKDHIFFLKAQAMS